MGPAGIPGGVGRTGLPGFAGGNYQGAKGTFDLSNMKINMIDS